MTDIERMVTQAQMVAKMEASQTLFDWYMKLQSEINSLREQLWLENS